MPEGITLKDGQDAGKALLMIEARIGELLPKSGKAGWATEASSTGRKRVKYPKEITNKQAERASVEEVKEEAKGKVN